MSISSTIRIAWIKFIKILTKTVYGLFLFGFDNNWLKILNLILTRVKILYILEEQDLSQRV